ncbi:MAG TPA: hypothetical protein GX734_01375 [Clostridiaceae bacterium]|nr:hypothetical protein [Clostridiaceae bacterium]
MGFSIESIIAIPCCLTILAQTTGLALPIARDTKRAANVNAYMSTIENQLGYMYRSETIMRETYQVPHVLACPQKIVESLSLTRDLYSMTRKWIDHQSGE